MPRPVFTVEERDRARERVLAIARADRRIVAGAIIGSQADGGGDCWSDFDLAFGLADGVAAAEVLRDWSRTLAEEMGAVVLFDLPFLSSIYRVFLLPGNLQMDLSFTPGTEFGALGPKFTLLFGTAVERERPAPTPPAQLFGLAVHHLVRARFSIERGRVWQAEYWISGARDQAMALACRRLGLEAAHARGADDLPRELTARFRDALVRSLDRAELMRALGCTVELLIAESEGAGPPGETLAGPLRDLTADWS